MPEPLWEAIETYVATLPNEDRSSWLRGLAQPALKAAGHSPTDPAIEQLARLRELIAVHGTEAVERKLDELAERALVAAGESGK